MIVQGSLTEADSRANIHKQSDIEEKTASEQISTRQSMGPKTGPMMNQPTFNWDTEDKYYDLKNFRLQLYNVFKSYDMQDMEKTAIIKNWLGRKGLQLLEMITQAKKGKCETSKGLFKTLNEKFKL